MKKLILPIVALILSTSVFAQNAHEEGNHTLHIGAGFPSVLTFNASTFEILYGEAETSSVPPLHLSYEYGFSDNWSGGLYVGYASEETRFKGTGNADAFGWDISYLIVDLRGSYHFKGGDRSKFDPYGNLMMGYNSASFNFVDESGFFKGLQFDASGLSYSLSIGANYMFSDNIGAFAEVGYGVAILNVGLTTRF